MNDKSSKVLHKLQTSNQGETNVIERTDQEMKSKKLLCYCKNSKMYSSLTLAINAWNAKICKCIQRCIPSLGGWSVTHHPSTLPQKPIPYPTSPHLQQKIES